MSTPKKRDLNQELVDFLLEQEGGKPTKKQPEADVSAATAATVANVGTAVTAATSATAPLSAAKKITKAPEISNPTKPTDAAEPKPNDEQAIEWDLDLGDGEIPAVDFHHANQATMRAMSRGRQRMIRPITKTVKLPQNNKADSKVGILEKMEVDALTVTVPGLRSRAEEAKAAPQGRVPEADVVPTRPVSVKPGATQPSASTAEKPLGLSISAFAKGMTPAAARAEGLKDEGSAERPSLSKEPVEMVAPSAVQPPQKQAAQPVSAPTLAAASTPAAAATAPIPRISRSSPVAYDNDLKSLKRVDDSVKRTDPPKSERRPGVTTTSAPKSQIILTEVSTLLGSSEALQTAQRRLASMEEEAEKLRDELEKLILGHDSLEKKTADLQTTLENERRQHKEKVEVLEEEKLVIKSRLAARENELGDLRRQYDDLKAQLKNDLRRIRARERDLEARQEIVRAENQAVLHAKDEVILELHRQLEQLQFELENFKSKASDMHMKLSEFQERNFRTIKALRLALSVLESGPVDGPVGENDNDHKKAAG